jgi:hypothetical protein
MCQEAFEARLKIEMGPAYVTREQAAARRKAYEAEQRQKRKQRRQYWNQTTKPAA